MLPTKNPISQLNTDKSLHILHFFLKKNMQGFINVQLEITCV